jgi:hypothetical protein
MVLVLDSGGLSRLAEASPLSAALVRQLTVAGLWPPIVPTVVIAESTSGRAGPDARVNRVLRACDVWPGLSPPTARRAGQLRSKAGRGSVVDAIVVATAEPGGTVLTGDEDDLTALAAHADGVAIEPI